MERRFRIFPRVAAFALVGSVLVAQAQHAAATDVSLGVTSLTLKVPSRLPSSITVPQIVYRGVAIPDRVVTQPLGYAGVSLPGIVTTQTLNYTGVALPATVMTRALTYYGVPLGRKMVPALQIPAGRAPARLPQ